MNHPSQDQGELYWTDGDDDTPVFQRPDEFDQLLRLYEALGPNRVLEIGTYYGGTLKQWIQRTFGGVVVSVDDYAVEGAGDTMRFRCWAEEEGVDLHLLRGSSHWRDIIESVEALAPYDWIFIDGSHVIEAVRRDWNHYGCMASDGGVVVFHDILEHPSHPEIQVHQLWKQIISEGYRTEEIVEDRLAPWGGYGIVYDVGSVR